MSHGHEYDKEQAYFGTHDWIAESALIVLYYYGGSLPAGAGFINLLYTDSNPYNLKMYFLLGTEAPDVRMSGDTSYLISLKDCEGDLYGSFDLTSTHHSMRFVNNTLVNQDAAIGAQNCYNLAVDALLKGKCQKAAFFLGAMCHYIADAGAYPHHFTIDDVSATDLGTYRDAYFQRITRLTYRGERFRSNLIVDNQCHDFFSIDYARNSFNPILGMMGWFAAYKVAEYVDAEKWYMWDRFKDHVNEWFIPIGESLDPIFKWHRSDFNSLVGHKAIYFNKVERHLNMAILYCAYTINLAISFYQDCNCGGKPNPALEELHEVLKSHANDHVIFIILGTSSLLCALYVIGLAMTEASFKLK